MGRILVHRSPRAATASDSTLDEFMQIIEPGLLRIWAEIVEGVLLGRLLESKRPVWIETTKAAHEHGGVGWEFGTCLWSPARNKAGVDSYALMREPVRGDFVLHFYEDRWPDGETETRLCGCSLISSPYQEIKREPPMAGQWAGRPSYYRLDLAEFERINPAVPIRTLRSTYADEIRAELLEDTPKNYPFARYKDEIRTNQGAYLTQATPRLVRLVGQILGIASAATNSAERERGLGDYAEGERHKREVFFFSRNPKLAAAAKAAHGYSCMVCGFDFERSYGSLGRGYIECHHLDPLSERPEAEWDNEVRTKIEDIAVLCSNCHRMVHRRRPALCLDEVRGALLLSAK